ncbi:hypothetical protein CAEBREN_02519 [Caenorhabditis brenneri]|uniref:RING-type domain-containing protein n=1 Tax=Caenorhabditis brenneri TaxID=135651 RepID=G0P1H8_CAEBE|nr:hypothetical protein CAEBREN_02519 [Caenorhabditis brenneri]
MPSEKVRKSRTEFEKREKIAARQRRDSKLPVPTGSPPRTTVIDVPELKSKIFAQRMEKLQQKLVAEQIEKAKMKSTIEAQEKIIGRLNEQLEDITSCSVCLQRYHATDRIPKMLSRCGHTICIECINRLHALLGYQGVKCPTCATITHTAIPDLLPKNYSVLPIDPI